MSNTPSHTCDIAVVGGGLAGLTLALALGQSGAQVILVERELPETLTKPSNDGRTTAITAAACQTLRDLEVWGGIASHAEPILQIRVADRASTMFIHFDHADIGDEPMGHIVDNHILRKALIDAQQEAPCLTPLWGETVTAFSGVGDRAELTLESGGTIAASLVIAADGRGSLLRRMAGIGLFATDYRDSAIVCTAHHELPHDGVAVEHFLEGGPFAILPMTDSPEGEHRSSIVWTEPRELAEQTAALPKDDFCDELAFRMSEYFGKVSVPGEVWTYPLSLTLAKQLTAPRLALVGEAAHGLHPIAGQGFNVTMRDIEAISKLASDALYAGRDPGVRSVLSAYARKRWPDILAMAAATDGLNRLFKAEPDAIATIRQFGLAAVNRMPLIKRQFQRHAMGFNVFERFDFLR